MEDKIEKDKNINKLRKSGTGFRGLLVKILVFIGIPVALGFVIVGFVLTSSVGNKIRNMSSTELETNSKLAASQISNYFARYQDMVQDLSSDSQLYDFFNEYKLGDNVLESKYYPGIERTLDNLYSKDTENVIGVWVVDVDASKLVQSGNYISDDSYHVKERPWFKKMEAAGKVIMTEPYEDFTTKKQIVSVITPIYKEGTKEIIGAAGADFSIEAINVALSSYKLGGTGFYILVTEEGQIIHHPDEQYINIGIEEADLSNEIKQSLLNGTEGTLEYTSKGEAIHGFVTLVGDSGWVLAASMPIDEFQSHTNEVTSSMILILAVVMAVVILLLIVVAKSIISPLKKLTKAANEIAQGNLDISIDINSKDETGHVADAIKETVVRLRSYIDYIQEISDVLESMAKGDMRIDLKQNYEGSFAPIKKALLDISRSLGESLYKIQVSAQQVDSGASQISNTAQALAAGSTEQASSIEQLSSSINDIASRAVHNTESTEKAKDFMEQAGKKIEESNIRMDEMLKAMEEINESSSEIQKIIKAIDDIAFQTNILALNAAVEAARAGNAGKGFAVVADEVRNLAARSAEAAKQTENLISVSMQAVNRGSGITQSTADALKEATEFTGKVQDFILEFNSDSKDQASAINQISLGVNQISAVVQTNAASAEESSASSEELSAQAALLYEEVGKFILSNDSTYAENGNIDEVKTKSCKSYGDDYTSDLKY